MSNSEMSRDDLRAHLRSADGVKADGDSKDGQDVGPLNRETLHEIEDLKEGDHSAAELASHHRKVDEAHQAEKQEPASIPLDADYVRSFYEKNQAGHPNGVAADRGR